MLSQEMMMCLKNAVDLGFCQELSRADSCLIVEVTKVICVVSLNTLAMWIFCLVGCCFCFCFRCQCRDHGACKSVH